MHSGGILPSAYLNGNHTCFTSRVHLFVVTQQPRGLQKEIQAVPTSTRVCRDKSKLKLGFCRCCQSWASATFRLLKTSVMVCSEMHYICAINNMEVSSISSEIMDGLTRGAVQSVLRKREFLVCQLQGKRSTAATSERAWTVNFPEFTYKMKWERRYSAENKTAILRNMLAGINRSDTCFEVKFSHCRVKA